jgi:hypothetical protein
VFDGSNLVALGNVQSVIYRITLEHAMESELKIIADGIPSKILAMTAPSKSVDIAIRKNLFLEALGGNGVVAGHYELLSP